MNSKKRIGNINTQHHATLLLTDFGTFHLFGYLAAILIEVSLGLVGGGSSILTVPGLVYLIGSSLVVSTSYSLFVVGSSC